MGVDQTGNFDPSTYGSNDITDPNVFAQVLSAVVETMTANGAKGVIGNIPAVTSLPYFTTVPHDALNPNDPDQEDYKNKIPLLNGFYDLYLNPIFEQIAPDRKVYFSPDEPSPMVIQDESLPNIKPIIKGALIAGGADEGFAEILSSQFGQSRQATTDDLMVLTSGGVIGTLNQAYYDDIIEKVGPELAGQLAVNGLTFPLEDQWVLLPSEQASIKTATASYNASIEAIVTQKGLGFVDAEGLLEQLASGGLASDGFIITGDYVTGGAFSLDGLHLNARGNAFFANEFLKSIDETYGSNFEDAGALVDIGDYPPLYGPILP